jgi:hypothetical protein
MVDNIDKIPNNITIVADSAYCSKDLCVLYKNLNNNCILSMKKKNNILEVYDENEVFNIIEKIRKVTCNKYKNRESRINSLKYLLDECNKYLSMSQEDIYSHKREIICEEVCELNILKNNILEKINKKTNGKNRYIIKNNNFFKITKLDNISNNEDE